MTRVAIIIPYFREHEKLKRCRAAIEAQSYPGCEVFVRDNTHDNILFTAAVNEGLRKFCYRDEFKFVMLLNQDAYLHKDCIATLVQFMNDSPDCGVACPLQVSELESQVQWSGAGPPQPADAGARTVTWGGSQQAFPNGVHRCGDLASFRAPSETYWANGAAMLVRTQVVRDIGLFDENMRFICSDADFSFTARARGWKVFVVPAALAEHSLSASGGGTNRELDRVKAKDALYFSRKWLNGDLYRELSWEGPSLTRIGVRATIERQQKRVDVYEGRAATLNDYLKLRLG